LINFSLTSFNTTYKIQPYFSELLRKQTNLNMKKNPHKFLIIRILLLIPFGIFSCNTDEVNARKDALIAKIWKVNKVIQKNSITEKESVIFQKTTAIKPATLGDDYWKMNYSFKIDGNDVHTYTYTDPRGKSHLGTWRFIENDSKIELQEDAFSIPKILIIRNLDKDIFNYSEINGKVEFIFEMN
jgi:hypothetical protein